MKWLIALLISLPLLSMFIVGQWWINLPELPRLGSLFTYLLLSGLGVWWMIKG
jgi:hypothetical protein